MGLAVEAHERNPSGETSKAVEDANATFVDSGLETTLGGHTDSVSGVAFNPDGSLLASSSHDGTVRLWNPSSGRLVRALHADPKSVSAVAFSTNGQVLATANKNGTVGLWEVASGHAEKPLDGQQASVTSVAFSRDDRLADGSADGTVQIWNARSRQALQTIRSPKATQMVTSVAFDPSGRTLAVGRDDGSVALYNSTTGEPADPISKDTQGKIFAVAFSPTKRLLATSSIDGTIKLWDTGNGELKANFVGDTQAGDVRALAVALQLRRRDVGEREWPGRQTLERQQR